LEEKGKTCGSEEAQFDETAEEVNSNNKDTDKNKQIHRAALSVQCPEHS